MLPLHITFRNLLSVIFILSILTSCSDKSETDLAVIKALDESIDYSNRSIVRSIEDILISLKDKMSDPGTSERAKYWYPKAQMIQYLSKEAFDNIERIKNDLNKEYDSEFDEVDIKKIFRNDSLDLYEMMINYRNKVLRVDSSITHEFKNSLRIFTNSLDIAKNNQKGLLMEYFKGSTIFASIAVLIKFQNNIRIIEEKILLYCHEHLERISFGPCVFILPLIGQSSSIVQAGEKIEIIAGIGSFYPYCKPEVFVYGRSVKLKYEGVAVYKLKAASKPGKYYVPVKINYINQDGRQTTVEKEIEYTVANLQKQ